VQPSDVIALPFNASNIVARLASIEELLEDDDGKEETDER
jgi:hypothetical protein